MAQSSKPKRAKKSGKGSVVVYPSNGRLQLRFRYQGERKYLSLYLSDTPENRNPAEAKAKLIEADIALERLDLSLNKSGVTQLQPKPPPNPQFWGSQTSKSPRIGGFRGKCVSPTSNRHQSDIRTPATPDLQSIWDKYKEYKKPQTELTTQLLNFKRVRGHLDKIPTLELTKADAIATRQFLISNNSLQTAKRILMFLNSACEWALDAG